MSLLDLTPLEAAYDAAVVAVLNACPTATEEEAEQVVDSLSKLIFETMRIYLKDQKNEPASSH